MKKTALLILFVLAMHPFAWAGGEAEDIPSLDEKFWMKMGFLMQYRNELQLSDDQLARLHQKSVEIKKAMVAAETQGKLVDLDVYHELHAAEPDVEKMKSLVDKEIEKERSLGYALVDGLATIQKMLRPEQKEKFKELRDGKKPSHG